MCIGVSLNHVVSECPGKLEVLDMRWRELGSSLNPPAVNYFARGACPRSRRSDLTTYTEYDDCHGCQILVRPS